MLDQVKSFSLETDRVVDFISIADAVPRVKNNPVHNHYTSPKVLIKLWDSLKRKLRDPNKRENEF